MRKDYLTFKGLKHTQETKDKLSKMKIGNTNGFKKGHQRNKGKILTEEHKKKCSLSLKGKKPWNTGLKGKGICVAWNKGKKHSQETIRKMIETRTIKDRSLLKKEDNRIGAIYQDWRLFILKRDQHRCKINNLDCKGRLEVHHILRYSEYPELRLDKNNGIVLCKFHHPRKKADEARLSPYFKELLNVKN